MDSPWLMIDPADYDSHMAHPDVDQSRLLADRLEEVVRRRRPRRLALPGVATGNGLERLHGVDFERITGIDLQASFLALCARRHGSALPALELVEADLETWAPEPGGYDLIHCALILEYLAPAPFLRRLVAGLAPGGVLSCLLQLPSPGHAAVSATPYAARLGILEEAIHLVDPERILTEAGALGLAIARNEEIRLASGKGFRWLEFLTD